MKITEDSIPNSIVVTSHEDWEAQQICAISPMHAALKSEYRSTDDMGTMTKTLRKYTYLEVPVTCLFFVMLLS